VSKETDRLLNAGRQDAYEARLEAKRIRREARRTEMQIERARAEDMRIRTLVDEGDLEDLGEDEF
jgi:hypothetical protein